MTASSPGRSMRGSPSTQVPTLSEREPTFLCRSTQCSYKGCVPAASYFKPELRPQGCRKPRSVRESHQQQKKAHRERTGSRLLVLMPGTAQKPMRFSLTLCPLSDRHASPGAAVPPRESPPPLPFPPPLPSLLLSFSFRPSPLSSPVSSPPFLSPLPFSSPPSPLPVLPLTLLWVRPPCLCHPLPQAAQAAQASPSIMRPLPHPVPMRHRPQAWPGAQVWTGTHSSTRSWDPLPTTTWRTADPSLLQHLQVKSRWSLETSWRGCGRVARGGSGARVPVPTRSRREQRPPHSPTETRAPPLLPVLGGVPPIQGDRSGTASSQGAWGHSWSFSEI